MFAKSFAPLLAATIMGCLCSISAADAGVFTVNRTAGAGTVTGTITTDGLLGVLATSDVTDWNLLLTVGASNFTLQGPLSGNNSALLVSGSSLSATATDLLFNFSALGFALFQSPIIGSGQNWWCVEGPSSGCTPYGQQGFNESIQIGSYPDGPHAAVAREGSQVIGTTTTTQVPEPLTLSLFSAGIVGVATLRRRKAAKA